MALIAVGAGVAQGSETRFWRLVPERPDWRWKRAGYSGVFRGVQGGLVVKGVLTVVDPFKAA